MTTVTALLTLTTVITLRCLFVKQARPTPPQALTISVCPSWLTLHTDSHYLQVTTSTSVFPTQTLTPTAQVTHPTSHHTQACQSLTTIPTKLSAVFQVATSSLVLSSTATDNDFPRSTSLFSTHSVRTKTSTLSQGVRLSVQPQTNYSTGSVTYYTLTTSTTPVVAVVVSLSQTLTLPTRTTLCSQPVTRTHTPTHTLQSSCSTSTTT